MPCRPHLVALLNSSSARIGTTAAFAACPPKGTVFGKFAAQLALHLLFCPRCDKCGVAGMAHLITNCNYRMRHCADHLMGDACVMLLMFMLHWSPYTTTG